MNEETTSECAQEITSATSEIVNSTIQASKPDECSKTSSDMSIVNTDQGEVTSESPQTLPRVTIKAAPRVRVAKAAVKPVEPVQLIASVAIDDIPMSMATTHIVETTDAGLVSDLAVDAALESPMASAAETTIESSVEPSIESMRIAEHSPIGNSGFAAQSEPGLEESAPALVHQPRQIHTPPLPDPRRRLRELLAIPDRDRSDALWDELIELEIQLAPGNRAQTPHQADTGRPQKQQRFADSNRRPAGQPGAVRHHRPQGANHVTANPAAANVANSAASGLGHPGTGAAKPGKRFFKKPRRGPRPVDKV